MRGDLYHGIGMRDVDILVKCHPSLKAYESISDLLLMFPPTKADGVFLRFCIHAKASLAMLHSLKGNVKPDFPMRW